MYRPGTKYMRPAATSVPPSRATQVASSQRRRRAASSAPRVGEAISTPGIPTASLGSGAGAGGRDSAAGRGGRGDRGLLTGLLGSRGDMVMAPGGRVQEVTPTQVRPPIESGNGVRGPVYVSCSALRVHRARRSGTA